jgi:hypothetical protein
MEEENKIDINKPVITGFYMGLGFMLACFIAGLIMYILSMIVLSNLY